MRAAAFVISMFVLPLALPAQARDYNDLSQWSLEDLCAKKDKRRHTEAIFAEIERREVFNSDEFELVRLGRIDLGMAEAALRCSWGAPDSVSQSDADAWHTYRDPIDRLNGTFDVHLIAERVTAVQIRGVNRAFVHTVPALDSENWRTFSGRIIDSNGVSDLISCTACSIASRP